MKAGWMVIALLAGCTQGQMARVGLGGPVGQILGDRADVGQCEADRAYTAMYGDRSPGETYCETVLKRARCWAGDPAYTPPWYDQSVRGQERPFCAKFGEAPKAVERKPLG